MSAEDLFAFVEGALSAEQARAVESHIAGCPSCPRAASALAGAAFDDQVEAAGRAGEPDQTGAVRATSGRRLGRFTLTRFLGRGAMEEVWAAHDPELDREVAVKLLHLPVDSARRASGGGDADEEE